jgi:DNA gyrase subunit A
MDLAPGDEVISMSVLEHIELGGEEREELLRFIAARRRANGSAEAGDAEPADSVEPKLLSAERLEELGAREQLVLTVTRNGYGKRTSAFEYRITHRGGQGIINIETSPRNGPVAAAFPVATGDQVILVTNRGQTIRFPVGDIRIAGRNTQGVRLFATEPGEQVVSAAHLPEAAGGEEEDAPAA